MPLAAPSLAAGLEAVAVEPEATAAECADAWADAVELWAAAIVPPSTTISAAAATLAGALATAFEAPAAAPGMETAFTAFAVTVGGGMAGYTPVPPPAPVGFAVLFAGAKPDTHEDGADAVTDLIDAWMQTGTATLIASPFTVLTWS